MLTRLFFSPPPSSLLSPPFQILCLEEFKINQQLLFKVGLEGGGREQSWK